MKKNDIDIETKIGGFFGGVAVCAIIVEMAVGKFTVVAIASGIKDIAGTLVAVFVFIVATGFLKAKTPKNFNEAIVKGLENTAKKYPNVFAEMLEKEGDNKIAINHNNSLKENFRYTLSTNIGALIGSGERTGKAASFCRFNKSSPTKITFDLNASTFGHEAINMGTVANKIAIGITNSYKDFFEVINVKGDEIVIEFSKEMTTARNAEMLISLIEYVILLYIIQFKGDD